MISRIEPPRPHLDRMAAWARVNAILADAGQDEALFGEWSATIGNLEQVDPTCAAQRILDRRNREA